MFLRKTTPDGRFTVDIQSVFEDPDADVPDLSLRQLVDLLEETALTLRAAQHEAERKLDATAGRLDALEARIDGELATIRRALAAKGSQ